MEQDQLLIKKRFAELAKRADASGVFTYTPFLGLAEQDILGRMKRDLPLPYALFGGAEGCERVIARFGTPELFGYDEPYPIRLLEARPLSQKFADKLTHRDVLGALMGLGIERSSTGDIILRDNRAFIFCSDKMADYVKENLSAAKHTPLAVSDCAELPEGELYKLERQELTVASARLDAVAAAWAKLSRGDMQELISKGLVFINGRQTERSADELPENAVVSVRGCGRFIFRGELRQTKKGRQVVSIDRFI